MPATTFQTVTEQYTCPECGTPVTCLASKYICESGKKLHLCGKCWMADPNLPPLSERKYSVPLTVEPTRAPLTGEVTPGIVDEDNLAAYHFLLDTTYPRTVEVAQ